MSWLGERQRHAMSSRGVSTRGGPVGPVGGIGVGRYTEVHKPVSTTSEEINKFDQLGGKYSDYIDEFLYERNVEFFEDLTEEARVELLEGLKRLTPTTKGYGVVTVHTTYSMSEYYDMIDNKLDHAKERLIRHFEETDNINMESYHDVFYTLFDIMDQDPNLTDKESQKFTQYSEEIYEDYKSLVKHLQNQQEESK